uniref:Uncharacterized protein n=1 Tax=Tetranychus urticae TaxID=32264 RepID=T1JZ58_TETUR
MGVYGAIFIIFPALGLIGHNWYCFNNGGFPCQGFYSYIVSRLAFLFITFGSFAGNISLADRSIISRMIQKDMIRQVYAFTSAIGGFNQLLSSLFYTTVFKATLDYNSGLVYIITGLLFTITLAKAIVLNIKKQKWDLVLIAEKYVGPRNGHDYSSSRVFEVYKKIL